MKGNSNMAKVTITKNAYKATNEKSADDIKAEISKATTSKADKQSELAAAIIDGKPQADIDTIMAQVVTLGNKASQLERDLSNPLMVESAREILTFMGDKLFELLKVSESAYAEMGSWAISQSADDDGNPVLNVSVRNPNVANSRAHLEAEIKPGKPDAKPTS